MAIVGLLSAAAAGSVSARTFARHVLPQASIGSSVGSFFDAVGSFFDSLSRVGWVPLLFGAVAFVIYLTLRSRAFFGVS